MCSIHFTHSNPNFIIIYSREISSISALEFSPLSIIIISICLSNSSEIIILNTLLNQINDQRIEDLTLPSKLMGISNILGLGLENKNGKRKNKKREKSPFLGMINLITFDKLL